MKVVLVDERENRVCQINDPPPRFRVSYPLRWLNVSDDSVAMDWVLRGGRVVPPDPKPVPTEEEILAIPLSIPEIEELLTKAGVTREQIQETKQKRLNRG